MGTIEAMALAGVMAEYRFSKEQAATMAMALDRHRRIARAALTALSENITPEMRQAALNELSSADVRDPKVAAWDAIRAFRAMLAEAMKEEG